MTILRCHYCRRHLYGGDESEYITKGGVRWAHARCVARQPYRRDGREDANDSATGVWVQPFAPDQEDLE